MLRRVSLVALVVASVFFPSFGGIPEANVSAAEPLIPVQGYVVTGSTVFDSAELEALVSGDVGPRTLAELEAVAEKITAHYRQAGYPLARAYIPAQEIGDDGTVEIAVIEGRFGQVRLENESRLRDHVALQMLAVLRPGDVVAGHRLVRAVKLLEEIPGVHARTGLAPGAEFGTSDLTVRLTDGDRFGGVLAVEQSGDAGAESGASGGESGSVRTSVAVNARNVSGAGDRLDVQAAAGDNTVFARVAYDLPAGDDGFRAGLAVSHSGYEVERVIGIYGLSGRTDTVEFRGRYPGLRAEAASGPGFRLEREDWTATVSMRRMSDEVAGLPAERRVTALALGSEFSGRLGGHPVIGGLTLTLAHLGIFDPLERDADARGPRTAGDFVKLNGTLQYERTGAQGVWMRTVLRGQLSTRNLHTSERLLLAGPTAVRAYAPGSVTGDHGVLLQLEAGGSLWSGRLGWSAFFDAGAVQVEHTPLGAEPTIRTLAGAGLGLVARLGGGFEADVRYAVPLSPIDSARWHVQVRYRW